MTNLRVSTRPRWTLAITILVMVSACSFATTSAPPDEDETPASAGGPLSPDPPEGAPDEEPHGGPEPTEPCRPARVADDDIVRVAAHAPMQLSVALASQTHRCAPTVVIASADDAWAVAIAVPVAIRHEAPLLLVGPVGVMTLAPELRRLGTDQVIAVGVSGQGLPGQIVDIGVAARSATDLAVQVATFLDVPALIAVPEDDPTGRVAALARADGDLGLLPLSDDRADVVRTAALLHPTARLRVLASDDEQASDLSDMLLAVGLDSAPVARPLFPAGTPTSWLVDPKQPAAAALAAAAAAGRNEVILPVDADDLLRDRRDVRRIRDSGPSQLILVGDFSDEATWQLPLILTGPELPGGGFTLFEDRRMVALYGSPETAALGAMGQQSLEDTIPRLREAAEPYGADDRRVLPAFEMITTIASASAEATGDYSRRTPIEVIRPWVDRAAEEDIYVILDLQPGRTDFLTQAKEYEELLLEPHVGLALDPEWRLGPDEVHLRQIGSVEAAEVQQVIDWLAGFVQEHNLPQKLLVLHQFRMSMLPDRDTLATHPQLAVVVHMDGQGSQDAKDGTYAAITQGAEDRWLWGWKNFYTEDDPVATPERVLALDPLPVFISYQ